jgi:hypothetical protein
MRLTVLAAVLLLTLAGGAWAMDSATASSEGEVEVDVGESSAPTSEVGQICFFSSVPPATVKYTLLKKLKVGKSTYGSVTDILPKFAAYAQKIGADAIIQYTGSQRFGFWPWRLVRPVVRGEAVKWFGVPDLDCAAMGGTTLETILGSNKAPD